MADKILREMIARENAKNKKPTKKGGEEMTEETTSEDESKMEMPMDNKPLSQSADVVQAMMEGDQESSESFPKEVVLMVDGEQMSGSELVDFVMNNADKIRAMGESTEESME